MIARIVPIIGNRKCQLICISPDGTLLAFGCKVRGTYCPQAILVTIRRISDSSIVDQFEHLVDDIGDPIKAMAFHPDSKQLVLLCVEEKETLCYLLVRKLKSIWTPENNVHYHQFARRRTNILVSAFEANRYDLSPVLLFLPDRSIVVMFHQQDLIYYRKLDGSANLNTVSEKAYKGELLEPHSPLFAIRVPRERWELGSEPVEIDKNGWK